MIALIMNSDLVPILLQHNPNVHLKDDEDNNALDIAAITGKLDTVKALLAHQDGKAFTKEEITSALDKLKAKNGKQVVWNFAAIELLLTNKLKA